MLNGLNGGTMIATMVMPTGTAVIMEIGTTGTGTTETAVTMEIVTLTAMVGADMVPAQMPADFGTRRGEITGRAIPQPRMT